MTNLSIYCDFDGTITTSDNIIAIMKKFAPPEWLAVKDEILSQHVSIQEGVGNLFALLPSTFKKDIITYLSSYAEIRSGFEDFVSFTKSKNVNLYVVSGGIDFFVKPLLNNFICEDHIFCNVANFSDSYIQIEWPHGCDEHCQKSCGCCKPSIIRKLNQPGDYKIVIGDSITDLEAAKCADLVLACDEFLINKCEELHLNYQPFTSFHEVITILQSTLSKVVKV
jgi:2-hydroxy-3-keto-5-methylthiopentenyl-1-phosphate phosphatase